jgi:serine/threonine protein kinase
MLSVEEGQDYDNVDEAELPYKYVRKLGHGHSGTVDRVIDRLTNKSYARKTIVVPRSRSHKDGITKIFHNEVRIIRRLGNHPHFISVFATYFTKNDFGLILQPVASHGDLEAYLNEYCNITNECGHSETSTKRLENTSSILRRAFGCLAVGLAFIHEKKLRHKDIKPRNILVHNGLVLYTDFGYSFDHSGISSSTTDGRPDFLTRKYSAPEVLDHEERNSSSDIFSLGCVFIEILSALTAAALHDDITSFSASMDDVHEQLAALQTPPWSSSLATVIISMTFREPSKRSCATQVARSILRAPESCCINCAKIPYNAWNTSMEEKKCIGQAVAMESVSIPESIKETDLVHAYKDAAQPEVFTITESSGFLSNLTGHVFFNDVTLDACNTAGVMGNVQNHQASVEDAELYTNTGTMKTASLPSSFPEESFGVSLDNHHTSGDATATIVSLAESSRLPGSSGDVDAQVRTDSRPRVPAPEDARRGIAFQGTPERGWYEEFNDRKCYVLRPNLGSR